MNGLFPFLKSVAEQTSPKTTRLAADKASWDSSAPGADEEKVFPILTRDFCPSLQAKNGPESSHALLE